MKRYISRKDSKYYTYMLNILNAIGGRKLNYNWLITDIEAYPMKDYNKERICREYVLISNNELLNLLEKEDFQWIWGLFSAIPHVYSEKEILEYELPHINDSSFQKEPCIQHPLAEIEIIAFDSSSVQITCKDEKVADMFLEKYKLSKQQY